ncbi:PfkB family carbohydrate kinase [Radiobacillus deserti]|uniref:Carbohydrate kinase PfkB domain-containing protein n=1 Tax=Radiobacillus deserti TaxID=2594883 RepID=A0A516KJ02_9BACI|nr:PfkB family carbohydrate kinase [Radiobacillus deserti]QDP41374.1 hypothetical protein FN924_15005 [Radiobacillus deserti]
MVLVPGANHTLSVEDITKQEALFDSCDILLTQLEVPLSVVEKAVELAYSKGKTVILNPAPAQVLSPKLLKMVHYLTPNEHELATISREKVESIDDAIQASHQVISLGVEHVITTLGAKGSIHVTQDSHDLVHSEPMQPVDTTGAGDAYNAGLATGLLTGLSVLDTMHLATKVSRKVIMKEGAQPSIPTMEEI